MLFVYLECATKNNLTTIIKVFLILILIGYSHLFLPAKIDPQLFDKSGLQYLKCMYVNDCFASFEQLCPTFNFSRSDFLRYFQLRDFASTHSSQFPQIPTQSGTDLILKAETLPTSHVSHLYKLVSPVVNKTRASWENEQQISPSDDFWEKALRAVNSSSSCARLSLIQFKVVHRIHNSKARIAKIYPGDTDDGCSRCSQTPCDLTRMFWSCPKLLNF